jgi:hypothetical protein
LPVAAGDAEQVAARHLVGGAGDADGARARLREAPFDVAVECAYFAGEAPPLCLLPGEGLLTGDGVGRAVKAGPVLVGDRVGDAGAGGCGDDDGDDETLTL